MHATAQKVLTLSSVFCEPEGANYLKLPQSFTN